MQDKDQDIESLLMDCDWNESARIPIAGDASQRQYTRLVRKADGLSAILMDARAVEPQSTRSFLKITSFLLSNGFSAPSIIATNPPNNLIVLEDLGLDLLARFSDKHPEKEHGVYLSAVTVLTELRKFPPPEGLEIFTPHTMATAIEPAFEFYASEIRNSAEIMFELEHCLELFSPHATSIALRDFHAENLLWMPKRDGFKKIGLIDYQDAVIAHPSYDLASIVRDVRREVSPDLAEKLISSYISTSGEDSDEFRAAFAIQSVQRNIRILGVFARLCITVGKQGYVDLISLVWKNILKDLNHPELKNLKTLFVTAFPEPTHGKLNSLKSRCKTSQIQ